MFLLLIPVVAVVLFFGIHEVVAIQVYGHHIKEKDLDLYFDKHLPTARLNSLNDEILELGRAPAVWTISTTPSAKWHIDDIGLVPRWSKWSKKLDAKQAELKPKKKKIQDYL